jgi:hypothetical protein
MFALRVVSVPSLVLLVLAACTDSTADRTCEAPEPGWCFCYEDPERVPMDEVNSCSKLQVEQQNLTSLCCEAADGDCECAAWGCFDEGGGFCACSMSILKGPGASAVASCTAGMASEHCCLSPGRDTCTCSLVECVGSDVEVQSCSVADVGCSASETSVEACK